MLRTRGRNAGLLIAAVAALGLTACGGGGGELDGEYNDGQWTVVVFDGDAVSMFRTTCSDDNEAILPDEPRRVGTLSDDGTQIAWRIPTSDGNVNTSLGGIVVTDAGDYRAIELDMPSGDNFELERAEPGDTEQMLEGQQQLCLPLGSTSN